MECQSNQKSFSDNEKVVYPLQFHQVGMRQRTLIYLLQAIKTQ